MLGVDRGASLGIMDFYGMQTENITISNNIMYQNCHDELLGVFSSQHWYKPDASVKGIYIRKNKLYPKNSGARRRTMVVTLAYDDSYNIEDVVFENNFIGGEFPSNCMTFGHFGPYGVYDYTEYCTVSDNIFNLNVTSSGGVIFDSRENVSIKNNTINFISGSNGLCIVFKRGGSFLQNTVKVDENAQIAGIAYTSGPVENNTFNILGKISNLTDSCFSVKNNTFFIYNPMNSFFTLPNACEDAEISGNTVYYNIKYEDDFDIKAKANDEEYRNQGWSRTHFFGSSVYPLSVNPDIYPTEEHTISFTNNTIYAPNASETNKHLAFFGKGSDMNKYIISDNKVEKFTWIRSQMGGKRNIIFERNSTISGEALNFNQEQSGKNNYIAGMENVPQNP